MNVLQSAKFGLALNPQSINGTDTDGTAIDTAGYNYLNVLFLLGATTADMDNLSIKECDTSGGTYAVITGTAMTAPTATDDNKIWQWGIALGGARKRYIKIRCDPGAAATLVGAVAILTKPNQGADTDTERGVAQSLFI